MTKRFELSVDCPNCGKKATISEMPKSIPRFGKALFSTISCEHCGIKFNNVLRLDRREPTAYRAVIESGKDLKTKIVRSSSSTVKIPELGASIHPTQLADGYYSNMEGLLERIQQVVELAKNASEEKKSRQNAEKILQKIAKARDGKLKFTVHLEDPLGGSALIGKKAQQLKLSATQKKRLMKQSPI